MVLLDHLIKNIVDHLMIVFFFLFCLHFISLLLVNKTLFLLEIKPLLHSLLLSKRVGPIIFTVEVETGFIIELVIGHIFIDFE